MKNTRANIFKPEKKINKALDNLSFQVKKGEILVYAGENGSGKSTTIKILKGILSPTTGRVKVLGKKKVISFLKQLNKERGTTIVVTSHDMADLEELAERIILLSKGTIAFDGCFNELREIEQSFVTY